MEEINLKELFFILRKWLRLIIGLLAISMVISGIISFYVLEKEYQAFTVLMIGKPQDYQTENTLEYNDLILSQKLVSTYSELIKSRTVSEKVIENLSLPTNYSEFASKVNVSLVKDTEIIKIEVKDSDPEIATEIANETSEVFMDTVKEIMKVENVQVIDLAQVPISPISPRPMVNIGISGALGLMLGVFIAFLKEFLDNSIKSPEDVEKYLGLPILGAIPYVEDKPFTLSNPKGIVSEAFRTLRTNIQFTNIDKNIRAIVITSSGPGEGKTTVVSNLAISIAQTEKSVLLIDCDMRKPSIHKVFGLHNQVGLTNILMGEKRLSDIKSLSIITSGPLPPNPAELLGSKMMKDFLKDMRKQFDIIIIDSPPINLVTDSAVLSTIADATIMVVEVGKTDIKAAMYGKELLDKVNANLIGIVLNKMPTKGKGYYNYSYYQYEEYYEDGEIEEKKEPLMIDIQTHILPNMDDAPKDVDIGPRDMDDGPKDMDMPLSISEIATPPHYTDAVKNKSNEDLRIGLEAIMKKLANSGRKNSKKPPHKR